MAGFVAEHNIPFTIMEHLPKLIHAVCPDSKISKGLKCGRTKSTSLVTNVIGAISKSRIIDDLKANKFSILLDESTDRSALKHLAVVARVVKNTGNYFSVKDEFITLIEVQIATAESLYNHVKQFFLENNIPYKENMIGYASDGANNMVGVNNSLKTKLTNDIPNLFVMTCICHSFHLCASYACLMLPRYIEDFARDVHNYINNSPKRLSIFKEFQIYLELKPYKILHPAQTRWLSLLSVVERLILQFPALKLYFTQAALEDKIANAQTILNTITAPLTFVYLQFLSFVLPFFIDLNLEMQSEDMKIHIVYDRISSIYKEILSCYIKRTHIQNKSCHEINYKNPQLYLPNEDIYIGGKVSATISTLLSENKIKASDVTEFKTRCLSFYVEAAKQINLRFPYISLTQVLQHFKMIDPKTIHGGKITTLEPMASQLPILFKNIDLDDVDREWRKLVNMDLEEEVVNSNVKEYWSKIFSLKKGDDTIMFPLMTLLIKNIMTLPHSTACVERIFSMINQIKTKERNRLNTSNLIGLLHSKRAMKDTNCYSMKYDKDYIQLFNTNMYNFK